MRTSARPTYRNGEGRSRRRNREAGRERSKSPNASSSKGKGEKSHSMLGETSKGGEDSSSLGDDLKQLQKKISESDSRRLWTLRVTEMTFDLIKRYVAMVAQFYYDDR